MSATQIQSTVNQRMNQESTRLLISSTPASDDVAYMSALVGNLCIVTHPALRDEIEWSSLVKDGNLNDTDEALNLITHTAEQPEV